MRAIVNYYTKPVSEIFAEPALILGRQTSPVLIPGWTDASKTIETRSRRGEVETVWQLMVVKHGEVEAMRRVLSGVFDDMNVRRLTERYREAFRLLALRGNRDAIELEIAKSTFDDPMASGAWLGLFESVGDGYDLFLELQPAVGWLVQQENSVQAGLEWLPSQWREEFREQVITQVESVVDEKGFKPSDSFPTGTFLDSVR